MNIIYQKILQIQSVSVKLLIIIISIGISVFGFCMVINSPINLKTANNFYYLIYHILYLFSWYFTIRLISLLFYSTTYKVKKNILAEEKEGRNITKWLYTKEESDTLKAYYTSKKRDNMKALLYMFLISICIPCLIILISLKSGSIEIIYLIISSIGIIMLGSRDFNNYNIVLKQKNISVVFSKAGYIISSSYTSAFNLKNRRLIAIKYNKRTQKLIFTFSKFSPGVDGEPNEVYNIKEKLPVPERYKDEVSKLKRILPIYNPF